MKWKIHIKRHRGFCKKYYQNSYPTYGNKGEAARMKNISLLDPSALTPGPGITNLTAGDENGAITVGVKSISKTAVASNVAYAIGGALLHKISATAVSNAGIWPHTITGSGAITGEDILHYKGKLLYTYNDAGAAGNMGSYDLSTTFTDDYWVTGLSGTALVNAPHQMIHGGDDIVYITNGRYIANLDDTTENDKALDFWTDSQAASITWNYNRVLAGVNRPNLAGVNVNQSAIYRWNGYSSSWEGDPIEINGRIGALFTKNGTTYVWYQGFLDGTVRLVFGMLSGLRVVPLATFSGSLPAYYQVGDIGNYVVWLSGDDLMVWGPVDSEVPVDMFHLMSAKYSTTVGGFGAPFGKILLASDNGSNYSLGKEDGYATDAEYKTIQLPPSGAEMKSVIDTIVLNTNLLAANARVDLVLRDNQGTSLWTGTYSHSVDGAVTKKTSHPRCSGENFRLEFDHSSGNATNPVKIRETIIEGHNVPSV